MTPNPSSSPATDFAVALLDEFIALGGRDMVLSPGSRSQALAIAAAGFERAGLLRLRVRIDERSAGFLALGLAVETGLPVIVVTTSGTAVANLHPAVLEAHHSGVPLIIATADRPEELRHIGSNQTAEQSGLFGPAIVWNWDVGAPTGEPGEADAAAAVIGDAWAAARTGHSGFAGPVHLNLAFTEPLSGVVTLPRGGAPRPVPTPGDAAAAAIDAATDDVIAHAVGEIVAGATDEAGREASTHRLSYEPGTVVIAGAGAGERAEATARALGAPLLAEVSSGAHFGPNLVVMYRELLNAAEFGAAVRRVIVFGHPTLSREFPALVQRADVTAYVVRTPGADDYNPGHRVQHFANDVVVEGEPDTSREARAWLGSWVMTSRALLEPEEPDIAVGLSNADFARRQLAIVREPVTRRMLAEAVWRATWPHDRLVLGASRLIREADSVVPGKKIRAHANRGLAGIDGTIATALGIALASQAEPGDTAAGTTRVLLGDLAALHDAGSLQLGVGEIRPHIQVIVGNDNGGTIFDGLEVGSDGPSVTLDRVMLTRQNIDFEKLAAAYGWEYARVTNRGELDSALTVSGPPILIEVPLER
ncbi:2-succinyl-5-enolpyruvyl-6-hydroxy-3-cyclohexene-1-carboxylic-acid synthase [Glaciihabitans sp. dw_435]|uniref:2-succinyl-5-enolpyruvyl-6-hydroxy-3- cyclohexene-1-carboxylic-acid synthase n=1 Tax=Glaciihabitans sp. dw_435 TaxID=2720081 RepID=UPI001BD31D8C|nr:2-succinyl-5-enolpyruvyl-6-hydroxy-3-cyclohexene-1-carboxylic-acid synthase [Glaciihabitans sp. dw_435]